MPKLTESATEATSKQGQTHLTVAPIVLAGLSAGAPAVKRKEKRKHLMPMLQATARVLLDPQSGPTPQPCPARPLAEAGSTPRHLTPDSSRLYSNRSGQCSPASSSYSLSDVSKNYDNHTAQWSPRPRHMGTLGHSVATRAPFRAESPHHDNRFHARSNTQEQRILHTTDASSVVLDLYCPDEDDDDSHFTTRSYASPSQSEQLPLDPESNDDRDLDHQPECTHQALPTLAQLNGFAALMQNLTLALGVQSTSNQPPVLDLVHDMLQATSPAPFVLPTLQLLLNEPAPDGHEGTPAEIEVPVEESTGGVEDQDDLWMCRLATLEANQVNIQRHLEEVMMAIPEMVVQALAAE
ncbi:UNVERIFIED_CONTAM: hypothetical protein K2H54_002701 [Gekko kuhli]